MKIAALRLIVILAVSLSLAVSAFSPPKPTADILEWSKLEVGAMYSFGMITMMQNVSNTQYFCLGVGGLGGWLPPASYFNPERFNPDNWLDAAAAFGAKYAVLVAQHCGGFSLWPSDISKETGFEYKYSTKYSPFKGGSYDLVQAFIDSCKKHNIRPGIYYSLNQNYYLNVGGGKIWKGNLIPGQANVTQDKYGEIILAQMRELWSKYGNLAELWFDGGCSVPGIADKIADLADKLQPHAVYFGGCARQNNLRWVGTESGLPGYPLWSTSKDCAVGLGSPDGNIFCPAESDTVLQKPHQWFYRKGFGIHSLAELQEIYLDTVGHNTNLLLNVAPTNEGIVEDSYMRRYREFGAWIEKCFGRPVIATKGSGSVIKLISAAGQPFQYNYVVVREDQSLGQAVTGFNITQVLPRVEKPLFTGQSIGNKLIVKMDAVNSAHELQLNIASYLQTPLIDFFGVYYCTD